MESKKPKRTKKPVLVDTLPFDDLKFEFKPYTVACRDCRTYYPVEREDMLIVCPTCNSSSYRMVD